MQETVRSYMHPHQEPVSSYPAQAIVRSFQSDVSSDFKEKVYPERGLVVTLFFIPDVGIKAGISITGDKQAELCFSLISYTFTYYNRLSKVQLDPY